MTAGIDVDVFACSHCGAPVPRSEPPPSACPSCGQAIEVPEAHREQRAIEAEHAELDREATQLAERIGKMPSPLVRSLVVFESSCAFVLALPFLLILSTVMAQAILLRLGPMLGRDLIQPDGRGVVFGSFVLAFAIFGQGLLAATYAGRRVAGLRALQAGLAAKPPARPGGAATCRSCGADMQIPAGALGVRCRYCSAENLVALNPGWIAGARAAKEKLASSFAEAAAAHVEEMARLRRSFRARMIGLGIAGVLFFGFVGAVLFGVEPAKPVTAADRMERATSVPRLQIDRSFTEGKSDVDLAPLLSPLPCDSPQHPKTFRFRPIACKESGSCVAPWYVALRRGDTIRLSTETGPRGLVAFYPQKDEPPFDKKSRGERIGLPAWVRPGLAAELTAPSEGYYLVLVSIEGAEPEVPYELCAQLIRPH